MKKISILLLIAFFLVKGISFAQEVSGNETLIETAAKETAYRERYSNALVDFTTLDPEYDTGTEIDYSAAYALTLEPEEADKLKATFALNSWKVVPQSSIQFPYIFEDSFTKSVTPISGIYEGQNVLGIRVTFPPYTFTMNSEITPPFRPDANDPKFVGKGVLINVGLVRSAYMTVYGLNQPEQLYLLTEDTSGNQYEYSFGDLKFIGWKTLEWVNPSYLEEVKNREVRSLPLYPQSSSNRLIKSIKVRRSPIFGTTDFVTYIRDIKLTYDKAIDDTLLTDIDNEAIWSIMRTRVSFRDSVLFQRTMVKKYLEYLEERKKYDYADADDADEAPTQDQQSAAPEGQ